MITVVSVAAAVLGILAVAVKLGRWVGSIEEHLEAQDAHLEAQDQHLRDQDDLLRKLGNRDDQ